MPMTTIRDKMAGFKKLSWAVSLYEPPIPPSEDNITNVLESPLVVICSWMGAQHKHLAKYTEGYKRLFPSANILIIQCSVLDAIFPASSLWHQLRIRRALEFIRMSYSRDTDNLQTKRPSLIIHAFSNGGSFTASLLLADFSSRKKEHCDALILDSCPGQGTYWRIARAFIIAAGAHRMQIVVKIVLSTIAYIGVFIGLALPNMLGVENTVSATRRSLNDVSLLDLGVPRLYIYSKTDQMVLWQDVYLHSEEARQKGYRCVRELVLSDTKHCAHILKDPERYWDTVLDITNEATINPLAENRGGISRL